MGLGNRFGEEVPDIMVELRLTPEEAAALRQALEGLLSELRMEIADTDVRDFRERLKARKEALAAVLERLPR